jgi:hypothetical protein
MMEKKKKTKAKEGQAFCRECFALSLYLLVVLSLFSLSLFLSFSPFPLFFSLLSFYRGREREGYIEGKRGRGEGGGDGRGKKKKRR